MSWKFDIGVPMPFEMRLVAHEHASQATMPVVRSSDEAWEAFARADEEFQQVLDSQRGAISALLSTNCFGDCVEGTSMHERVSTALRGDRQSITGYLANQAEYLDAHASSCRTSARSLRSADDSSTG